MTERPILFSGEMVREILSGKKTMTRRIMNPQPKPLSSFIPATIPVACDVMSGYDHGRGFLDAKNQVLLPHFPYNTGDRLYVRETWTYTEADGVKSGYFYRADLHDDQGHAWPSVKSTDVVLWHPSIHMPKEAARIWLDVLDVRAERLQDIAEVDAGKEGLPANAISPDLTDRKGLFRHLWVHLYGSESWNANPWVWVVEFKRIIM